MNLFSKCTGFSILVPLLGVSLLVNDWKQRPPESWTWQDVLQILNESPWVRISPTSYAAPAVRRPAYGSTIKGNVSNRIIPFFPAIRLLTAKPMRDALLRQSFLQELYGWGVGGQPIDVKTLTREASDRAKEAQDRFAKSNPIMMGDQEHIVISIAFTTTNVNVPDHVILSDVTFSNPLEDVQQSDLIPVTVLSTRTGKRMVPTQHLPPGKGGLGAILFFSRKASDGNPAIVIEDKELRFETRIKDKKIEVKFDLSKLVYQGRLEL